ncbi:hypothetical protein [uncultured Ilyobacter sp.]|uniref:hypothetical protein n=1 Tax=uncultured Ilyobacter sp. TaxID=544433 RepID=UPI0029F58111|nr:hypothetical protein [uncultured Ilyobacter sp.]
MEIKFRMSEIKSFSEFLTDIENKVVKNGFSFIILINDTQKRDIREFVQEIKNHFDIFILEGAYIPSSKKQVENCFFNGFHGTYYLDKKEILNIDEEILKYTSLLFPKGSIFLEYSGSDRTIVDKILKMDYIPVIKSCDLELLDYTRMKIKKSKKLSRYLKYVPLLEQIKCEYRMGDKLKRKVILETDNLRQKLMIKNVDDSFNSSGL